MDTEFKLLELGPSLAKHVKYEVGDSFTAHFEVLRPFGDYDHAKVIRNQKRLTLLGILGGALLLRGQVLFIDDSQEYLFVGSVKVTSMDDLESVGLNIGDFAPHDPVLDFLLLLNQTGSDHTEAQDLIDGLKSQRLIYEELFNNAPYYVCLFNSDARAVFQNLPLQKLLGTIGIAQQPLSDLVLPEDHPRVQKDIHHCIKGMTLAPYEFAAKKSNGDRIHFDGRLVPFHVEGLPEMATGYFVQRGHPV